MLNNAIGFKKNLELSSRNKSSTDLCCLTFQEHKISVIRIKILLIYPHIISSLFLDLEVFNSE
jgi:hypothetical protein